MYFEIKNKKISDIIEELCSLEKLKLLTVEKIIDGSEKFLDDYVKGIEKNIDLFMNTYKIKHKKRLLDSLEDRKESKKMSWLNFEDVIIEVYQVNNKLFFCLNYSLPEINEEINKLFNKIDLNDIEELAKKPLFNFNYIEAYQIRRNNNLLF